MQDDLLLALFSGGGSSLLSLPAPGVSMVELEDAYGSASQERRRYPAKSNTVRKHLSAIAGGRLAAASRGAGAGAHHLGRHRRRSDATSPRALRGRPDDASTTRKPSSPSTASSSAGAFSESPKTSPGQRIRSSRPPTARSRRRPKYSSERGIQPEILGDTITGEAREVGREMARLARRTPGARRADLRRRMHRDHRKCKGNEAGRGGRCYGVSALSRDRDPGDLGDCRRHRRHRRQRGQRRAILLRRRA